MRTLALVLSCSVLSCDVAAQSPSLEVRTLVLGNRELTVEVARTAKEQETGLMHRERLPDTHGMLFVFSPPRRVAMWMKNTPLDLDAAFIDRCGRILRIARMKRNSTELHSWPGLSAYVLEVNAGWFDRNAISAGARVPSLSDPAVCRSDD